MKVNENTTLNNKYDYYKYVKVDDRTVGFALYSRNLNNRFISDLILEYCFVIDEYIDKIQFWDDVLFANNILTAMHNPKRIYIDLLLKEGIAEHINERFLELHQDLLCDKVDIEDTLTRTINSNDEIEIKDKNKCVYCTSFYDLELSSAAIDSLELRGEVDNTILSYCYEEDDIKYDCLNKRQKDPRIKENEYHYNFLDIQNIWTAETNGFNDYDYFIDDNDSVKTEEYYINGEYKNSENYKKFFKDLKFY